MSVAPRQLTRQSQIAAMPRWSALGGGLRNTEFPKFWTGQTVSGRGPQITLLALPLIVVGLNASAAQMGILRAMQFLPFLLLGLPAGVWIDRLRRRPLLMAADLGRAALLLTLPVAAAFGVLRLEHVFAIAFATGGLTVVFDVAQQAFVPALVKRDQLTEANEKLEVSRALGQTVGPGLGGVLIQLCGTAMPSSARNWRKTSLRYA